MSLLTNRSRDAEIAVKLFGFDGDPNDAPHYSTEPEPADRVMSKLKSVGIDVVISSGSSGWHVSLWMKNTKSHSSMALCWPLALADAVMNPEILEALK